MYENIIHTITKKLNGDFNCVEGMYIYMYNLQKTQEEMGMIGWYILKIEKVVWVGKANRHTRVY